MRCVPQDENTGGFFVTLLRKVCEMPADVNKNSDETATETAACTTKNADGDEDEEAADGSISKRAKVDPTDKELSGFGQMHSEYYRPVSNEIITDVKKFFELSDEFPFDQLFTRNEGAAKSITYLTKTVKENVIDSARQDRLKVTHTHIWCLFTLSIF
jgi:tRNA (cytosine34-C5)-methyltransferase